jgi:hypothetical protein
MIRIVCIALVTLIICQSSSAQIKKGATLLGGQLIVNTQRSSNSSIVNPYSSGWITIAPAFGKAIKEDLVLGGELSFGYSGTKYDGSSYQENRSNSYGAHIFLRRYRTLGKGFFLFGEARTGFDYGHTRYLNPQSPSTEYTQNTASADLSFYPGLAYTLTNKLQLEAGFTNLALIRYSHGRTSGSSTVVGGSSDSFTLSSSLSSNAGLSFGFRVLLN